MPSFLKNLLVPDSILGAESALRNSLTRGMQGRSDQYTPLPEISSQQKQAYANEELVKRLQQKMYNDQARLALAPTPIYPGKTIAPMSAMTQNARQLRDYYAAKGAPKGNKINTLLQREATGFTPEQTQGLLDMIKSNGTSEQLVLDRLQKQFGQNFGYEENRGQRLSGKLNKDINNNLEVSRNNLNSLNDELSTIEGRRSLQAIDALRKSGQLKGARREGLIGQLEEFGNQKHAFDNLKNRADRDVFEEEVSSPYNKINSAQQSLNRIDYENSHPDMAEVNNRLLQKLITTYDAPHTNYPGQRVVPIQPETEASFDIANQISPKYKDVYANDRKDIEQNFLNNTLPSKIYNQLPEAVNPIMNNLDYLAKKQLKRETKDIAGRHIRQGSYGSGAHKAETERQLRDVARRIQAEREGTVLSGIRNQGSLLGRQEENDLNRYGVMAQEGAREFNDLLQRNASLNKLGWQKRANRQGEENEALRAWYGQNANEWPGLQNNVTAQGRNLGSMIGANNVLSPFENLAQGYNTDLTSLFSQPNLFDENNRAFNAYRTEDSRRIRDQHSATQRAAEAQAAAERANQERLARERELAAARVPVNNPMSPNTGSNPTNDNYARFNNSFNNMQNVYGSYAQRVGRHNVDPGFTQYMNDMKNIYATGLGNPEAARAQLPSDWRSTYERYNPYGAWTSQGRIIS